MTTASDAVRTDGVTDSERAANAECAQATDTVCRIGVLSPHNSKETKAILNAVRALGHEPVWIRDENVASWIEGGRVRLSPRVDALVTGSSSPRATTNSRTSNSPRSTGRRRRS